MVQPPRSRPAPGPVERHNPWLLLAAVVGCAAGLGWLGYARLYPEWQADTALSAAKAAAADADYDRARAELEKFLTLRPAGAEGLFLLARTCRQTDDLAGARKHLAESKRLGWSPDDAEIEAHLIEAQEVGPRGMNEKVLQGLVLRQHPAEKVVLEGLAKGYRNAHLPEAAVKWLGIWIARHPDDWLPHQWRGEILAAFNLMDEARTDFLRVVERRPRYQAARRQLGRIELAFKHDPVAAEGHFAVLLETAPTDPGGLLGMAECRRRQGDAAGAREYLDRLLAAEPGNVRACAEYATLEEAAARPADALRWAARAEAAFPDEPELHYQVALLYTRLGKADAAAPHMARFKQLDESYRKTAGWIKALVADPTNADLRYQIGEEFLRLGRDASAVAWFSSALLEKPDHRPTHRALAAYYRKAGEAGRAAEHERLADPSLGRR